MFNYPWFRIDKLNGFIAVFIGLFFLLTLVYSAAFMRKKERLVEYYFYIVLTGLVSIAAVLTNNLILLLALWGLLGATLYILVSMGDDAALISKKTFIIVGGSDALMLLGIAIIYYLGGTFQMDKINIPLSGGSIFLPLVAYLCLAAASFAKAGVMPLHSWIPDCAKTAPVPVVAFLPSSVDKLLGIYLLARISLHLFVLNAAMHAALMLIGAFTIIFAVAMALMQNNMKKLLGYSTVSQVGYMVLGIGTGNPIGIAGGLFHMLNHAIYKSCLFFCAGNVEYRAKTSRLDELGGLSKLMPLTYIAALIAACSISGIPPFNGFFSKWMIYQGLVDSLRSSDNLIRVTSIICLVAAMAGSGFTIAVLLKFIHAVFLGRQPKNDIFSKIKEAPLSMVLPGALLAVLCVTFGIFALQIPLRWIMPIVGAANFTGTWQAGLSSALIIVALVLGLLISKVRMFKANVREDSAYVGCEPMDLDENRVSGTDFYQTIKDLRPFKMIYRKAEAGAFDIYDSSRKGVFFFSSVLRYLHNGILPTYLVWCLLGMVGLFIWLVK